MPRKQKNGLYRARIKIGTDAAGKNIYKYVSGKTKKELEQNRQQAIKFYITGAALGEDRIFGEYAQEWFQLRLKPKVSPSSVDSYRNALNNHILPIFGSRNLRAIKPLEIQRFIDGYAGKSASTITYIFATFRRIYKSAMADRIVDSDPTKSVTKPSATPADEKRALTPSERARVCQVCQSHEYGLYLALLYYLGVRPGEAAGFMWDDVDWEKSMIHVRRDVDYKAEGQIGALKTKKSLRDVPIPTPLFELLKKHRGLPGTFIIPGAAPTSPPSKTVTRRMWLILMQACGMTAPAKEGNKYEKWSLASKLQPTITPHYLRHNYITMCWESGLDVYSTSRIVGHSNITTTLKIYTHLTEKQQEASAKKINAMFENTPNIDPAIPTSNTIAFHLK